MSTPSDWSRLVGYADRLSVRPGEVLRVMVSAESDPQARVISLPRREPVAADVRPLAPVKPQPVRTGSSVVVEDPPLLDAGEPLAFSTWVWLAPGAPADGRAELIAADGYALVLEGLLPRFEAAGAAVDAGAEIERGTWVELTGALDPSSGEISMTVSGVTVSAPAAVDPRPRIDGPLVLGVGLDGKLDRPRLGGHDLRGEGINGPVRAVTGHTWKGDVHDWRLAPDQYTAMHFHRDAVDDLAWEANFEVVLDEELDPGVYALELTLDGVADVVPFALRRSATAPAAPNVVLLPTFTYLAYSCELTAPASAGSEQSEDRWVAEHGMRSLYDRHRDGVGVYEASLLRPLTQLRPGYACAQHGGPHGLAQDLILLDWLRRNEIEFDVVCDHDLDGEGSAALSGARTVITGAHPEYASERMLEALEEHLAGGGSLAYLGGNGLNGSVSVDATRPHVIELRRTETQGLVWQALPGEHHHTSGAYGGDWRRRGRPEHRMLGVGLRAWGDGPAVAYRRPQDEHPAAAIVFAGLDPGEDIDGEGVVLGGPAGYEVDAYDPRAGSPADAIVLASAEMPEGYELWPDDVIDDPATPPPLRADMTLHRRTEGGAVFAVGSIAWTGCLGDDDNAVSRVTANVLAELQRPRPFADD